MPNKSSNKKCFINKKTDYRDKDEVRETVCRSLPAEYESEGYYYCLLHHPDIYKAADFKIEFEKRFNAKDYSYRGVFFPYNLYIADYSFSTYADFFDATFSGRIIFQNCLFEQQVTFSGALFEEHLSITNSTFADEVRFTESEFEKSVDFSGTKFLEDAGFEYAEFSGSSNFKNSYFNNLAEFDESKFLSSVSFESAKFKEVIIFDKAQFLEEVSFSKASFEKSGFFNKALFEEKSQTFFQETKFNEVVGFNYVVLKGYMAFEGKADNKLFSNDFARLDFQNARVQNPERILFHSVRLQPNWFINVDCKRFIFTSCEWNQSNGRKINTRDELKNLSVRKIDNNFSLLAHTCRQLADNFEEKKEFGNASDFRLIANEAKRLSDNRGLKIQSIHWWYWLSSFYGESWQRALGILIIILSIFAGIYMLTDFQVCPLNKPITQSLAENLCEIKPLDVRDAILQSLSTATFQATEYRKPFTRWGELFILLEKIFAPLQATLLALAVRRKFMS